MSVIGNILWFIFAGFWQGVSWCLVGLVWCITIVGIPVGTQCFKMAGLAFFPFGKEVEYLRRGPALCLGQPVLPPSGGGAHPPARPDAL